MVASFDDDRRSLSAAQLAMIAGRLGVSFTDLAGTDLAGPGQARDASPQALLAAAGRIRDRALRERLLELLELMAQARTSSRTPASGAA